MIEFKTLLCDICKERPMKKQEERNRYWIGVCEECSKEKSNSNQKNYE
jgi:hypothetical protein